MNAQRTRPILIAAAVIVVAWLLAVVGYTLAKHSRVTAEKLRAYVESVDLSKLSGGERAKAIRTLADMLNALSLEERRRARLERAWAEWFEQMTEEERSGFVEATMPTGFKQMLVSFEQMPEQNRRVAIDEAVKRLKELRETMERDGELPPEMATNAPPVLSEELRQKVIKIGLQAYYSESSAQTKAELAPLLEEVQRMMESGRFFRPRGHHD